MLGGSTEQEGAACGGVERDPQQDELGLLTLIGFSIFPWQTQADRIVMLGGSTFQERKELSVYKTRFKGGPDERRD